MPATAEPAPAPAAPVAPPKGEPLEGRLGQREALLRLLRRLAAIRLPIAIALFMAVVWSGVNLGYGYCAKLFFDTIQKYGGTDELWRLNVCAGLAVAATFGRAGIYFVMEQAWTYASNRLVMYLRNEVYSHLQRQSVAYFDRHTTGQLLSSLSTDIPALTSVLDVVQEAITLPLVLVGGGVLLFVLNWQLALVSVLCMAPAAWAVTYASRRIKAHTRNMAHAAMGAASHSTETLSCARVVQAFGNERYEAERYRTRMRQVLRYAMRGRRARAALRPTLDILGTAAFGTVLWSAGWVAIHQRGAMSLGTLFWFAMVLRQVVSAVRDISEVSANLAAAGVAADRVFTLLDTQPEVQDRPGARDLERVEGRVVFERVGFEYHKGRPVLRDVSLTLEPGKVVAVVGPTGAGKSTLAGLVLRFYEATEGRITVDGVDLRDCTLASLRKVIGVVPQESVLFAGTLLDNIAYGRLDASEAEIIAAAKAANAWEFIEKLPDGLRTAVGPRGVTLSGGQRQRVAIARALLRNPRILILDEATSALDTSSEALVQDALQRLMESRSTLVIAHRLSTIRDADEIVVLKDGRVAERGRHEALIRQEGVYAGLYRTQFCSEAARAGAER
jgi:subfamily B ATP-binding cassette protein MsbA